MMITNAPAKIADRLWMLGTSAYPIYLIEGNDQLTLFEGGIGAMGPVLREQFSELGFQWDSLRQLVITHAHPDHVMAVPLVRQIAPQVRVMASDVAAKTLANEKAVSFFCKMDDALSEALIRDGVIHQEYRRAPLAACQIDVDQVLKEGDSVTVDDSDLPACFEVLATGGHSDCSLSFYEPNQKILIISDATGYFLPQHDGWWPNYFGDYGAYVASIERLAQLDTETLCLSHNGIVTGADEVSQYFQNALAATKSYHERICEEAHRGDSTRTIAERLGNEIHAKVPVMPVEFFQKNCGLLVKKSIWHEGIETS